MIKKLLFFILLVCSVAVYSQKKITKLTASPNPFVNSTTITFHSEADQNITFSVRNVIGKTVLTRKIKVKKGNNKIPFSKNNLKSGMYLYSIRSEVKVTSKRFVIR
ncbi:T9SS type A sorting domain-containing protein [Flavobacteriaceae bacterium S356]|uniref:T9SS type A sorting domain-containing protein n=1 Tax=Asprobacillus argus TaxID=3076534 RepID=A0ABU3LGM0_9FLAO|nr:T9SS type A sorting domain-containing protein [Flavobacteriaceae bacterium S356]